MLRVSPRHSFEGKFHQDLQMKTTTSAIFKVTHQVPAIVLSKVSFFKDSLSTSVFLFFETFGRSRVKLLCQVHGFSFR